MSNIAITFWRWLFMRSSQNAAHPNPGNTPYNLCIPSSTHKGAEIIEVSTEEEVYVGSTMSIGNQVIIAKGAADELIRTKKKLSFWGTCGHSISKEDCAKSETSEKKIAKCYYCEMDNYELLKQGLMTLEEAERRSIICPSCVRQTTSGKLSCPNHAQEVIDENGKPIYIGREEQQELKRKQLMQNSQQPLLDLFFDQVPQPKIQKEDLHE